MGTGDRKVPGTRRLESLRYRGAAVAEAVAIAIHKVFGVAVAVVGIAAILFIILFVAKDFIEGIFGIGCVALGAGFAAFASGVVDQFNGVVGLFRVVKEPALRLGAIGHD